MRYPRPKGLRIIGQGLLTLLLCLMFSALRAYAGDCPQDPFELWKGKHLRGANIFQGRNSGGGPDGIGDGEFLQSDFDELRRAGANYVHLSHAGTFGETPPYALDAIVEASLDATIRRAKAAGLYVVIAFRSGPGRNENAISNRSGPLREGIWTFSDARTAWVKMLKHTATRYRNDGAVVGYSLMVEPNAYARRGFPGPEEFYAEHRGSVEDVNTLYTLATAAIRSVDLVTPILLEPDGYGGIDWLPFLGITGDARAVYSAHDYTPFEYTHEISDGLSYPGSYDLDSDGVSEQVNRAFLTDLLRPLERFSRDHAVPVALTEFGVHRSAPNAGTYIGDRIVIQSILGSWAVWTWQPAGFNDPFSVHEPSGVLTALRAGWASNCSPRFTRSSTRFGSVHGQALSFNRKPLRNVKVRLGGLTVVTGERGNFYLTAPSGIYTMSATQGSSRCRVGSRNGRSRARIAVKRSARREINVLCQGG